MATFPTLEFYKAHIDMARKYKFPYTDEYGVSHNVEPTITKVKPLTDRQIELLKVYRERRKLWIAERDMI